MKSRSNLKNAQVEGNDKDALPEFLIQSSNFFPKCAQHYDLFLKMLAALPILQLGTARITLLKEPNDQDWFRRYSHSFTGQLLRLGRQLSPLFDNPPIPAFTPLL